MQQKNQEFQVLLAEQKQGGALRNYNHDDISRLMLNVRIGWQMILGSLDRLDGLLSKSFVLRHFVISSDSFIVREAATHTNGIVEEIASFLEQAQNSIWRTQVV
jgi:hypothetical protein